MAAPVPVSRSERALAGILFLSACGEAFQAYGTLNSSPQTTELFAAARETTLMKWVRIGHLNAFVLGGLGAWISRSLWPLVGTLLVMGELEFLYRHAATCGKRNAPPVANQGVWAVNDDHGGRSAPTVTRRG
jgi:hypothetical protein